MSTFSLQDVADRISEPLPKRLRGRELGLRYSTALQSYVCEHVTTDLLRLDLHDAPMMDVSFMDEVFGGFAEARGRGELPGAALLLIQLSDYDRDDIERVLSGRPGYVIGLRNCVLPYLSETGIGLLGKTEDYVAQTFALLQKFGTLTTADLMDRLNLANNTASTRLKVLFDLGLARRQGQSGSRGYVYLALR